jgi:hypothetical protein
MLSADCFLDMSVGLFAERSIVFRITGHKALCIFHERSMNGFSLRQTKGGGQALQRAPCNAIFGVFVAKPDEQ